ncbi:kinase-like domain-containing protein [Glomus cerebriforme]|uniref:Kinase-like domain-containing protein n=1 Tax=Glomus cerebriforme TaxID=658196 RepID=A0A397T2I1_9GLOM|nr:kinase-like domain-containing protein [Glomus cerebriforme]
MQYANHGNLRQFLNGEFNSLSCHDNFKGFNDFEYFISDLGLSKPANEKSEKNKKNVYRALSYPEVLRGKIYTQESDVYSFGIIMYEIFTGLPPYYDMPHE